MVEDERVQIMMNLGLTRLQAKVYLALSQAGKAKIETISKASNIARQDIYRILPALQKMGLAERVMAKPTVYKATPMKEGLFILLRFKAEEYAYLKKKTKSLVKSRREHNGAIMPQDEEPRLTIISGEASTVRTCIKEIGASQASIKFVGPEEPIRYALFHFLRDFEKALKRGVKIQIITEKPESIEAILQRMPQTFNELDFSVRYQSHSQLLTLSICDDKRVHLCTLIPSNRNGPHAWSNNPVFALMATAYFDKLWNSARESKVVAE